MDLDLFADPESKYTLIQRYDNEPDILAIEEFGAMDNYTSVPNDIELIVVVPTNSARSDIVAVAEPISNQHTPTEQYPWPGRPDVYPYRILVENVRYTTRDLVRKALEDNGHTWAAPWKVKRADLAPADLFPPKEVRYGAGAPASLVSEPANRDRKIWPDELDENSSYAEGASRQVTVNKYERDERARTHCLRYYGPVCQVCDFDFGEEYGSEAEGFIHVHHRKPLSEVGENYRANPIKDLVPVCPNCHAVIHMDGDTKSLDEVRAMLEEARRNK